MWLIKLTFRLLALWIIPVIAVLSIFYKLFLNLSSMVISLDYLVLALCLVIAITEHSMLAVAVVMEFGVVGFLAVMFAEVLSMGLDAVVGMLAGFIFHNVYLPHGDFRNYHEALLYLEVVEYGIMQHIDRPARS